MTEFKSLENDKYQPKGDQEKKMKRARENKKITAISLFNELTGNGLEQDYLFEIPSNPSTLDMWRLIEKTGIKREEVCGTFTTDEAVAELYRLVYRRIHYRREQEMIRRLKVYVERLKEKEISG